MSNSIALPKKVRRIALLGGGAQLPVIAKQVVEVGFELTILTAPRHAEEQIGTGGGTLAEVMSQQGLAFSMAENWKDGWTLSKKEMSETIALSLGAAWIFKPQDLEDIFCNNLFNLHGTRLPTYRGGGGFSWQILNGNRLGFTLIHQIDGGIDTGTILSLHEFLYPMACRTPQQYADYYAEKLLSFLKSFFKSLQEGSFVPDIVSQPEYLSQYWPRLHTDTHGWINWNWGLHELDRFVCAFDEPYGGAQTFWGNQVVRLRKSMADMHDGAFHPFQSGIVFRTNGRWLNIAVNGGSLIICEALDTDGNNILSKIKVGDRFYTPGENLEASAERVIYTAKGKKVL